MRLPKPEKGHWVQNLPKLTPLEGSYVACIVKCCTDGYIVSTITATMLCMLETSVKGWGKGVMELALGSHLWQ